MIGIITYFLFSIFQIGTGSVSEPKNNIGYEVGKYPPLFEFRKILGETSVETISWENLKGKVVIVDFWATWCVPCIITIPHINKLVEKYKDKPVVFISVAYEPESLVLPFLEKHPISAIKALDDDFSTFQVFRAWAIPLVVIVNKEGKISRRIHPNYLTEDIINEVLLDKIPIVKQSVDDQFEPEAAEKYFRSLME